jgi:hypothetical protein
MEVKVYSNQSAKKYISKLLKNKIILEPEFYNSIHINRWLEEQRDVKLYCLCETNNVITVILLSKCDFDPYNKHKTPYLLDYIYTFLEYRRNQFAYKLLLYLKKKEQITAFCSNDSSELLFKKAEYVFSGYDKIMNTLPIFRFP